MSDRSAPYFSEIGGDVKGILGDVTGGTVNQYIIAQQSGVEIRSQPLIPGSPYVGLRKFRGIDKDKFFGRDRHIRDLSEDLKENKLLLLLGASGSGKSSLILAGLIPHLEDTWGTSKFLSLNLVPGKDPFRSLSRKIPDRYLDRVDDLLSAPELAETVLTQVSAYLQQDYQQQLIFIDQFEQLFTLADASKRQLFINSLLSLIEQKKPSVYLVMTMRSDFMDRLSQYPGLATVLERHIRLIKAMTRDELRLAIAEPAARNHVTFEGHLVERIIDDFLGQAGSLPLLQYTLDFLWEKDKELDDLADRVLNIKTYDTIGGVAGALQQQADKIYQELTKDEQEIAEKIFVELVDIVDEKRVSRPVPLSKFQDNGSQAKVLKTLVDNRLLVKGKEEREGVPTLQVAHEALLRSWSIIDDLYRREEEIILLRRRLIADANQWQSLSQKELEKAQDELWGGSKLAQVQELQQEGKLGQLDNGVNEFIEASIAWSERLQRQQEERRQLERMRRLAAQSQVIFLTEGSELTDRGLLLAVEAMRRSTELGVQSLEVDQALRQGLKLTARRYAPPIQVNSLQCLGIHPAAPTVALGQQDGQICFWRLNTGQIEVGPNLGSAIQQIAFSPDGQWLAAGDEVGNCLLLNTENRAIRSLETLSNGQPTGVVSFSPDSTYLAVAFYNQVRVWHTHTAAEPMLLEHPGDKSISSMTFSADATVLVTQAIQGEALCWYWQSKTIGHKFQMSLLGGVQILHSPDGRFLGFCSCPLGYDVVLWDLYTREGHELAKNGARLAFSADSRFAAIASPESIARIWQLPELTERHTLRHDAEVWDLDFSGDSSFLVTQGKNNVARVWSADTGAEVARIVHPEHLQMARFLPGSRHVLTRSGEGILTLWDTKQRCELMLLEHRLPVLGVAFSPEGRFLATQARRGHMNLVPLLWDLATGQGVATVPLGEGQEIQAAEYAQKLLDARDQIASGLVKSPNGALVATANPTGVEIYCSAAILAGKEIEGKPTCILAHDRAVRRIVFSPNSRYLVTASDRETARIWDVELGEEVSRLTHEHRSVVDVDFSPNGRLVATASWDGTARVWLWQPEDLIREASTRLSRNLSAEEWRQFLPDEPYRLTIPESQVRPDLVAQDRRANG